MLNIVHFLRRQKLEKVRQGIPRVVWLSVVGGHKPIDILRQQWEVNPCAPRDEMFTPKQMIVLWAAEIVGHAWTLGTVNLLPAPCAIRETNLEKPRLLLALLGAVEPKPR